MVARLTALASLALAAAFALPAAEASAKGAKIKVEHSSEYGDIVVNGHGEALYLFTKDSEPRSTCYDACAVAWPPLLTKGRPVAGRGLSGRRIGTTRRADGTRQVTYRGHPLYYYVHDTPSLITCQDVFEYGGKWLLVDDRGKAVR